MNGVNEANASGEPGALVVRQDGDALVIEGKPLGFVGAARAPALIGLGKNGCLLVGLVVLLAGAFFSQGEDDASGSGVFVAVLLAIVVLAVATVALRVFFIERRSSRLRVGDGQVEFEARGALRHHNEKWRFDEIELVRVGRTSWGVDALASSYLEIVGRGQSWCLFEQYDEAELRRVEEVLGQALGLQTGDSWRPGSTDRRPISAPASSVVNLHTDAGRLEVRVPVAGLLYRAVGSLRALLVLAAIAGLIAASLGYGLPGSFASTPRGVMLLAGVALAGYAVLRVVAPSCAATLVLRAGDGALALAPPLRPRRSWQCNEIERLAVEHLEEGDEDLTLVPVLALWTRKGKRRILLRHDRVIGRGAVHELYWAADQLQRHLTIS